VHRAGIRIAPGSRSWHEHTNVPGTVVRGSSPLEPIDIPRRRTSPHDSGLFAPSRRRRLPSPHQLGNTCGFRSRSTVPGVRPRPFERDWTTHRIRLDGRFQHATASVTSGKKRAADSLGACSHRFSPSRSYTTIRKPAGSVVEVRTHDKRLQTSPRHNPALAASICFGAIGLGDVNSCGGRRVRAMAR
jgi:hypothetical protein